MPMCILMDFLGIILFFTGGGFLEAPNVMSIIGLCMVAVGLTGTVIYYVDLNDEVKSLKEQVNKQTKRN